MFGEDFLGLRELGITSELGVSTLSVPKKLLRPKGTRMGAGSSLPYVKPLLACSLLPRSSTVFLFAVQKQTDGTSTTLPTATSIRPTRVNEDGRRSYWTLATFLQVSFRYPRTISAYSLQTPTSHRGWHHSGQGSFDITTYTIYLRASATATSPFLDTTTADCATAYTVSITCITRSSGRCAEPGPNEDGTSWADRWWEIDERCHEEETEEGERSHVAGN